MAQAQSVTTFVMSARLPWPDDAPPADACGALDPIDFFIKGERRAGAIRRISPLGTTIRGAAARSPGEEVSVELETGQRPAGTIDWVDMLALLTRKLVAQLGERRTMPRVELRCRVGLKWGANLATATLRNISARGLQVEAEDLPGRDSFVSLFIDGLIVPAGEVVWRKGNLAGIELMEELSWSSIMPWIREVGRKGVE
jgi:hypothetical protein